MGGAVTELRPYQNDVVAEYERTIEAGRRRIMLVAPTGSGKTICLLLISPKDESAA
jgi:superfamily II DNA or RNA helicase